MKSLQEFFNGRTLLASLPLGHPHPFGHSHFPHYVDKLAFTNFFWHGSSLSESSVHIPMADCVFCNFILDLTFTFSVSTFHLFAALSSLLASFLLWLSVFGKCRCVKCNLNHDVGWLVLLVGIKVHACFYCVKQGLAAWLFFLNCFLSEVVLEKLFYTLHVVVSSPWAWPSAENHWPNVAWEEWHR